MSDKETHNDFTHLATRYLSGELSPDEIRHFEEILSQDPEKREQFGEFRKIWDSVGVVSEKKSYNLDAEWELLRAKLPGFGSVRDSSVHSFIYYTYRIAAVFVVGLVLTFAWIFTTRLAGTEVILAENEPLEVMLGDGTEVYLNRDSKIRYSKNFDETERRILLNGEAWFDVARDTARPFVIDAGKAMVEVLGTSFNVNAYKENSTVEITVESGVVALTAKQDLQEQIVLRAGNGGTYHKENKELELVPDYDPNNLSWKTKELYFDNTSLAEVANLINKVYNTRLVIMNPELSTCTITVSFRNQSLEAVLKVLEKTLDLEISEAGDEIRLDGEGCVE